jgi:hypothetical protein
MAHAIDSYRSNIIRTLFEDPFVRMSVDSMIEAARPMFSGIQNDRPDLID